MSYSFLSDLLMGMPHLKLVTGVCMKSYRVGVFSRDSRIPEMLMRVVSILPPLVEMLSMKVGPPVRLILDKLTFTNSRLMLKESFLPVTEDGSSSTVPAGEAFSNNCNLLHKSHRFICESTES